MFSSRIRTKFKWRPTNATSLPCLGLPRLVAITSSSSSGRPIRRSSSWACSVSELRPVNTIRPIMKMRPKTPPAMKISIDLLPAGVVEHCRIETIAGGFHPRRVDRADAGCAELSHHLAGVTDAAAHELEQVLHHHHVAFHPADLRDLHAPARAVAETAHVHDDVDGGSGLLAHRALRNRVASQEHHHLEAAQ